MGTTQNWTRENHSRDSAFSCARTRLALDQLIGGRAISDAEEPAVIADQLDVPMIMRGLVFIRGHPALAGGDCGDDDLGDRVLGRAASGLFTHLRLVRRKTRRLQKALNDSTGPRAGS